MKNLYVCSFVAVAVAMTACARSDKSPNAQANLTNKQPAVGAEAELPLARAAKAFKADHFDPNKAENKALAEEVGGATMSVVGPDKVSPAQIQVALKKGCEVFTAKMWGGEGKPADVKRSRVPTMS